MSEYHSPEEVLAGHDTLSEQMSQILADPVRYQSAEFGECLQAKHDLHDAIILWGLSDVILRRQGEHDVPTDARRNKKPPGYDQEGPWDHEDHPDFHEAA